MNRKSTRRLTIYELTLRLQVCLLAALSDEQILAQADPDDNDEDGILSGT
ncbi:MAG: hypothetical protein R3B93_06150 [Bacteroidia bacterium]